MQADKNSFHQVSGVDGNLFGTRGKTTVYKCLCELKDLCYSVIKLYKTKCSRLYLSNTDPVNMQLLNCYTCVDGDVFGKEVDK